MSFFGFLKKKEPGASPAPAASPAAPLLLGAPAKGTFVPMSQIPDEVFSTGVLGTCCGVEPEDGNIYAPVDGTVSQVADTRHAVGLESGGLELLLHVGVDTVEMNGDGFTAAVQVGQRVRKGDLLLTVDRKKVYEAGHPATVILAVTNSEDLSSVEEAASGAVEPGDPVLRVTP